MSEPPNKSEMLRKHFAGRTDTGADPDVQGEASAAPAQAGRTPTPKPPAPQPPAPAPPPRKPQPPAPKGPPLGAGKLGDPVCGCGDTPPPDPDVEEHVTVWDVEGKGNRYWDESSRTLKIVQTQPTDTVDLRYTGPTPPTEMEVYCNGTHKASLGGGTSWSHDVTYTTGSDPYAGWGLALMPLREIATFSAPVSTWEFRSDQFTVTVEVYNPDQWKLKLKSPPRYKKQKLSESWSAKDAKRTNVTILEEHNSDAGKLATKSTESRAEAKDGTTRATLKTTEASAAGGGRKTEVKSTSLDAKSSQIADLVYNDATGSYVVGQVRSTVSVSAKSLEVNSGESSPAGFLPGSDYVTLSRNTTPLQVRALDYIGVALRLLSAFQRIKQSIKDNVPEIGWCWDMEFAVLDGDATFTWGWKEHSDHRVYYELGLGTSMTLVSVSGKIGIGIQGWGFAGQAMLEAGGAIKAAAGPSQWQFGLDSTIPNEIKIASVAGEIELSIYILVKAGDLASVQAGARSTLLEIAGDIQWRQSDSFLLKGDTTFKGVEVFATIKIKYWYDKNTSFEVLKSQDLGSFQFPKKGKPKEDDYASVYDVESAVEEAFEDSFWFWNDPDFHRTVTYRMQSKSLFTGKVKTRTVTEKIEVSSANIFADIARRIWDRRARLEMTQATIKGLIYGIRADLTEGGNSVDVEDLNRYLSSAKFAMRLTDAECPAKCTILDHNLA